MGIAPKPGDIYPLGSGDAIILEVQDYHGTIRVLASRDHPVHPFAVWYWNEGGLYSGRYFKTLTEAETYWETS